jgi:hypothetical protein
VDQGGSLDDTEKFKSLTLPVLELLSLSRPARRQSLYRLSYRGSNEEIYRLLIGKISG